MILKREEICDLMEKIWIEKELYILTYDFWKFLPFSDFLFDFYLYFLY